MKKKEVEKAIKAWTKIDSIIKENNLEFLIDNSNLTEHLREVDELMTTVSKVITQVLNVSRKSIEIVQKLKDDHEKIKFQ